MSLLWTQAVAPTRYVTHHELGQMYSADFDVPMHKALPEMDAYHNDWEHNPERHPGALKHGSSTAYVNHLAKDIAKNGMQEPITVRGENVVKDGHHRALAAMKLKMDKIPVRDIR